MALTYATPTIQVILSALVEAADWPLYWVMCLSHLASSKFKCNVISSVLLHCLCVESMGINVY